MGYWKWLYKSIKECPRELKLSALLFTSIFVPSLLVIIHPILIFLEIPSVFLAITYVKYVDEVK